MDPSTLDYFSNIEYEELFANVGKPIVDRYYLIKWPEQVHVLHTWPEAFWFCKKSMGENGPRRARWREYLAKLTNPDDDLYFCTWHALSMELDHVLTPMVHEKVAALVSPIPPPPEFEEAVQLDVRGALVEKFYDDATGPLAIGPAFFKDLVDFWYLDGRFPCGWREVSWSDRPQLVVF